VPLRVIAPDTSTKIGCVCEGGCEEQGEREVVEGVGGFCISPRNGVLVSGGYAKTPRIDNDKSFFLTNVADMVL
jgi:hypothetical protein